MLVHLSRGSNNTHCQLESLGLRYPYHRVSGWTLNSVPFTSTDSYSEGPFNNNTKSEFEAAFELAEQGEKLILGR